MGVFEAKEKEITWADSFRELIGQEARRALAKLFARGARRINYLRDESEYSAVAARVAANSVRETDLLVRLASGDPATGLLRFFDGRGGCALANPSPFPVTIVIARRDGKSLESLRDLIGQMQQPGTQRLHLADVRLERRLV